MNKVHEFLDSAVERAVQNLGRSFEADFKDSFHYRATITAVNNVTGEKDAWPIFARLGRGKAGKSTFSKIKIVLRDLSGSGQDYEWSHGPAASADEVGSSIAEYIKDSPTYKNRSS